MQVTHWREAVSKPVLLETTDLGICWDAVGFGHTVSLAALKYIRECRRMNGQKGTGALLFSGGLDSTVLLILAGRFGTYPHTFTVGSHETHPDIVAARAITSKLGIALSHHECIPTALEIFEAKMKLISTGQKDTDGNTAVLLALQAVRNAGFRSVMAGDGIDELLGGYWTHRQEDNPREQTRTFQEYWRRLPEDHLIPLEEKAEALGLTVLLPYLNTRIVESVSRIPLRNRTTRGQSKIPLRLLAERIGVPDMALRRDKTGFVDALNPKAKLFRA